MGRPRNFVEDANVSLDVRFEEEGHKLNESFTLHKTSVLSYEQVANNFKFSKSLIDSKLYQLDMLPVMCMFDDDGKPTSHDTDQLAYGAVIPNSARWEETTNGEEYLFVDCVLWNGRFEELNNIGNANQSMEINGIKGKYNKEERFYEVNDFNFSCLTILNENVNPAFKQAKMDNGEFSDAFEKFKEEFSEALKSIDLSQYEKGGDNNMEDNKEKNVDTTTSEMNDETKDTDETKVDGANTDTEDMAKDEEDGKKSKCEEEQEDEDTDEDDENGNFELSHEDVRDLLVKKLDTYDANGYRNYDVWICEVFDTYCIYQKWSESHKYYKAEYTKFEQDVIVGTQVEVFAKYLTQPEIDTLEQAKADGERRFEELSVKYSELESEATSLRKFKEDKDEEVAKAEAEMEMSKKTELVNSFADRLSSDEIDTVVGVTEDKKFEDAIKEKTFEEIKVALSVAFADKVLGEKESNNEKSTFANIDTSNKSVSTKEKLLAELKARNKK